MKKLLASACCVAFIFCAASCTQESEVQCLHNTQTKIDFAFSSLEDSLPAIKSKKELVGFFGRHLAVANVFFGRKNFPNDSVFINHYYRKFSHPSMDTLLLETKKVFGDDRALKEEFRTVFSNLKYFYPDVKLPRVVTLISGIENDLSVSDSLIIVSLDFYLGKKAKYRPNMYEYILKRYEKNFIVPSVALLYGIDAHFNKVNLNDRILLADMVSYGKAYYFAKQLLPCVPDSVFIGYTGKEIAGAEANQDMIWKKLIEDEALFSTSQQIKQRFIGERPKVYEIGNECPGRIAAWVGWKIIKEYMKQNPSFTLLQMMQTSDAQKILKDSKYRPGDK